MKLFLVYYKRKELPYIIKEKGDADNLYIYNGSKYSQLVKKYSGLMSKINLWYIIGRLIKNLRSMDLTMMDVNLYYPYVNINQIVSPGIPLIWRVTGNILKQNETRMGHLFNENYRAGGKLFLALTKKLMENCSAIITTSEWLKNELRSAINQKNIFTIYKNVDTKMFNPKIKGGNFRKSLNIKDNPVILLSVMQGSFFQKVKGFIYYFNVLKRLNTRYGKKIVCLICGDGFYFRHLRNYASKLKLHNVFFLGFQSKLNEIYAASDIFIHPSLLDAAPQVIREAGISRKPIITSDIGGIPELIDSKHCFFVNPQNEGILFSVIEKLIDDKNLRAEFGNKAFESINKRNQISSGKLFWKVFHKYRR